MVSKLWGVDIGPLGVDIGPKKKKDGRGRNIGSFHPVTVTLLKLDYTSSSFGIELVMIIASFSESFSPK